MIPAPRTRFATARRNKGRRTRDSYHAVLRDVELLLLTLREQDDFANPTVRDMVVKIHQRVREALHGL
jgi:hypothetical protein